MKKNILTGLSLALVFGAVVTGCGTQAVLSEPAEETPESSSALVLQEEEDAGKQTETDFVQTQKELEVRFGDAGEPFTMHLYDNDSAAAIARHVETSDWRLPIYHNEDYENWEVMQYYDISNRYEIPSSPEQMTEEKAGTVYYSELNRILLFYQDAEVSAKYTPVGYFDYTDGFLQAVQENPVLKGWGNKIIQISDGE